MYDASFNVLNISGMANAPKPKNIPKRFRLAIFFSSQLKSEIKALVAPLITPPPIPKNRILRRSIQIENVWPIPMKPIANNKQAVDNTHR